MSIHKDPSGEDVVTNMARMLGEATTKAQEDPSNRVLLFEHATIAASCVLVVRSVCESPIKYPKALGHSVAATMSDAAAASPMCVNPDFSIASGHLIKQLGSTADKSQKAILGFLTIVQNERLIQRLRQRRKPPAEAYPFLLHNRITRLTHIRRDSKARELLGGFYKSLERQSRMGLYMETRD